MKKLTINKEYLVRHAFVALLMLGMGGWFGYDGVVTYPSTDAAALYASIEGEAAPKEMTTEALDKFKDQKIKTQLGLMTCCLLAAVWIVIGIIKAKKFNFEWDDNGFTYNGKHYAFNDVKNVDRAFWKKKGIVTLEVADGKIRLDAWHHSGVKEIVESGKI